MYVTPKYIYFNAALKAQQIELFCFLDDGTDITTTCKFELEDNKGDLKLIKNVIKAEKNPSKSINKIGVLYEKNGITQQDFCMLYVQ